MTGELQRTRDQERGAASSLTWKPGGAVLAQMAGKELSCILAHPLHPTLFIGTVRCLLSPLALAPTPYILHPSLYAVHPTSYTVHPRPEPPKRAWLAAHEW